MDKTSRALRRHHRARLLRRAIKTYQNWGWPDDPDHLLWKARRSYNNMAVCSCVMCCNERRNPWLKKYDQLTMQEKKAYNRFCYEMEELVHGSPEDRW